MPRCPDSKCKGTTTERGREWWHCDTCECWFPGAHMRAKGALKSTAPKRGTRTKSAKKSGARKKTISPAKIKVPKIPKVKKKRAKGLVAIPKGLD